MGGVCHGQRHGTRALPHDRGVGDRRAGVECRAGQLPPGRQPPGPAAAGGVPREGVPGRVAAAHDAGPAAHGGRRGSTGPAPGHGGAVAAPRPCRGTRAGAGPPGPAVPSATAQCRRPAALRGRRLHPRGPCRPRQWPRVPGGQAQWVQGRAAGEGCARASLLRCKHGMPFCAASCTGVASPARSDAVARRAASACVSWTAAWVACCWSRQRPRRTWMPTSACTSASRCCPWRARGTSRSRGRCPSRKRRASAVDSGRGDAFSPFAESASLPLL